MHVHTRTHQHAAHTRSARVALATVTGPLCRALQIMNTQHVIDGHQVAQPEFARNNGGTPASPRGPPRGRAADVAKGALKGAARKIFVGGLSHQTHESALRMYFEQFGELTDIVVMHEAGGRKPRGFGFVTFADPASVQKVLQS